MIDQVLEYFRLLNVVLGFTAFVWTLLKMNRWWDAYDPAVRGLTMALLFFSFATTYGSAEQYLQHVQNGYRPLFTTVACISLLIGLWRLRGTSLANFRR